MDAGMDDAPRQFLNVPVMSSSKKPPQLPRIVKLPSKTASVAPVEDAIVSTASYISVVAVHTTLWAFAALYLPRTSFLTDIVKPEWDAGQQSSKDRPQHPFLEALTMNPTYTLACICLGAVLLQSWWADFLRNWWLQLGLRGTVSEKSAERAHLDQHKLLAFRDAWLATFAASAVTHFVLVLFGAPITSNVLKTYLLALLISTMTIYCPAYVVGVPTLGNSSASVVKRWTLVRLFAEFSVRNPVERAMIYPAIGTVIGCWLGIVPIALDWDRPWQAWPLTPCFGAIGGYIVSSMTALTVQAVVEQAQERLDGSESKVD